MSIRARIISLGSVAIAISAIMLVVTPAFDHLGAKASTEQEIQRQINGIVGVIQQQAWMRDFDLCMRIHQEEPHAIDLCRQEADEKMEARKRITTENPE